MQTYRFRTTTPPLRGIGPLPPTVVVTVVGRPIAYYSPPVGRVDPIL